MLRFSTLIAALAFAGVAHADDRRDNLTQLKIMSWNVEFMWDGIAPEDGSSSIKFEHRGNPELAARKMGKIATVIRKLDPDIVVLDEVESLVALELLNNRDLPGLGYKAYLRKSRDTFTGQDVGILTRIDPDEPLWREDRKGRSGDTAKSASKNFLAKFTIGGDRIALIGVHFLSRPTDPRRLHARQAQADSILNAAKELDAAGYHVIVAGDINDYDGSPEASDHQSNQPISNVVARLRGMDDATPTDDLINVAQFVPKHRRYTCHWDKNENDRIDGKGELTSIDHILLAPELAKRVSAARIQNNFEPHGISDHFPIVVTISTDPDKTPAPITIPEPEEGAAPLRLVRILPNPAGDEKTDENATLKNMTEDAVSLEGWQLRDKAGTTWELDADGQLDPGAELTITRDGRRMAMNNGGDNIELVNPAGEVVQSMTYTSTRSDQEIVTGFP